MSDILKTFARVTRTNRCPICKSVDWCLVAKDGSKVICPRVPSDKIAGEAGWMHTLAEPFKLEYSPVKKERREPVRDMGWLAASYIKNIHFARVVTLAAKLKTYCGTIQKLRVGWDGEAYTFPMFDESMRIVGIRRRFPDGMKLSVKGGHEGVFIPEGSLSRTGPVYIAEGASDAATLFDLGLSSIGRPSCTGGKQIIRSLVRNRDVVIVADADVPNRFGVKPGEEGAERLADELVSAGCNVKVIVPLAGKDVREWSPARRVIDCVVANTKFWMKRSA